MFQAIGEKKKGTQGFTDDFGCLMGLLWDDLLWEWKPDLLEEQSTSRMGTLENANSVLYPWMDARK